MPAPTDPVPTCRDGERNGTETGIDCGMAACSKACAVGQGCGGDVDCDGGACVDKVCQAPDCDDGLQNGSETDMDCGGADGCNTCDVGQNCDLVSDCNGGDCVRRICQAMSCGDALLNATETDVDCGGSECDPCGVGKRCVETKDCDGLACVKGKCQAAACGDGIINQDETDLDCGGSCDATCADGLRCKVAGDCESGVCPKQTLRCAAPTCEDGVKNGAEPAKDCGAPCATKCATLDPCNSAADCQAMSCVNQRCLPAKATGEKLSPLGWVATASHTSDENTNSPQFAIDGADGTDWTTGKPQTLGMWFQIDMKAPQVLFSIEIYSRQLGDAAQSFNVSLSEDGTFSDPPVLKNVDSHHTDVALTFKTPQVARYIRFTLTQGGDTWWRMNEIRVKQ